MSQDFLKDISQRHRSRLTRIFSVEWMGQTVASICWIASVFVYGISSVGDWLQLTAASCWLAANLAAVCTNESDQQRSLTE